MDIGQSTPSSVSDGSEIGFFSEAFLSRVPTVFGRLAYLASLCDERSGEYWSPEPARLPNGPALHARLAEAHLTAFLLWADLPLPEQHRDFRRYLADKRNGADPSLLRRWQDQRLYIRFLPAGINPHQGALFVQDFALVLASVLRDFEAPEQSAVRRPGTSPQHQHAS